MKLSPHRQKVKPPYAFIFLFGHNRSFCGQDVNDSRYRTGSLARAAPVAGVVRVLPCHR